MASATISLNQLQAVYPSAAEAFLDNEADLMADPEEAVDYTPIDPDDANLFMVITPDHGLYDEAYDIEGKNYIHFDQNGFTNITLYFDGEAWGG